ncbi:hypothetical protein MKX47_20980 [Solibacillus sp. FSL R7-0668]|uniref:hypothetical protein n=1 Tax=Solibacillus sp. FSL R7-0668 TaxID=2921688 RepID=UPI0030FAED14
MQKVRFKSVEALKRRNSVPSTVLVAPSGSGKSTCCNTIINPEMNEAMSVGVGKNQTTKLSTQFILDSRIERDDVCSILIEKKSVDLKLVQKKILDETYKLFIKNGYSSEDIFDELEEDFFEGILSPSDAMYNLKQIENLLDEEKLVEALAPILLEIDKVFSEKVTERKKNIDSKNMKLKDIRKLVFEDLWDTFEEQKELLNLYLKHVEVLIDLELKSLVGIEENNHQEILIEKLILNEEGIKFLQKLYNPAAIYSLIIRDIKIACRPHIELINAHQGNYPFRFAIRDTMGINQDKSDVDFISDGIERAFSYDTDSILILISLIEREDVIKTSLEAIYNKLDDLKKRKSIEKPVYILFTKADDFIENKVSMKKSKLAITQEDYYNFTLQAIEEIEEEIGVWGDKSKLPFVNTYWVSMRYKDLKIDPIQQAVEGNEEWLSRLNPKGLYSYVAKICNDCQLKALPEGQVHPLMVTPLDYDKNVLELRLDNLFSDNIKFITEELTLNEYNFNEYYKKIVENKFLFHGRAVSTYWSKLTYGEGHKTRANVYANFNLNMKGLIRKVMLNESFKNILINSIELDLSNVGESEIVNIATYFNKQGLLDNEEIDQVIAYLEILVKNYFENNIYQYYSILDQVAYKASYANPYIRKSLEEAYYRYMSYDNSLREVQKEFYKLFSEKEFLIIVQKEFEKELTGTINKLFVAI